MPCIDLDDLRTVWGSSLELRGSRLEVVGPAGRTRASIDTRTHRLVEERASPSEDAGTSWNNRWMITNLDFVGVPSQDWERSRHFYGETLGLRPDDHAPTDFWVGSTCLGIWEPERFGMEFAPQKNAHLALHVDDVAAARSELEAKGVSFAGEILDTGVCHMTFFTDPDGNDLMLHHRYAPYE